MHVANEKMSGKIFLWAREPVALIKRAMSVPGAIGYPWTEVINNQTRSWTRSLTILAGSGAGVEISIKNRIRSLSWNFYLKTGSGAGVEISIKNRIRSRSWNFYKKLDQESELYYGSFSFRLSFAYVRESWKKIQFKMKYDNKSQHPPLWLLFGIHTTTAIIFFGIVIQWVHLDVSDAEAVWINFESK